MHVSNSYRETVVGRSSLVAFAVSIFLLATPSLSLATITSVDVVEVSQSLVPGFRTFDIKVSGTGQLTELQMLSDLHYGSFFQHPEVSEAFIPPSEALIADYPDLAFDTFVAAGSATLSETTTPQVTGGAVSLGGASTLTFDDLLLDVTWTPPEMASVLNPTGFLIARLALSEDACGEINLRATALENEVESYFDYAFELEPLPLPGDYNGSGCVESGDLNLLLDNWGQPTSPRPPGWIGPLPPEGPGFFEAGALNVILDNWGQCQCMDHQTSALSAIPEPAATGCGLIGLVALAGLARPSLK